MNILTVKQIVNYIYTKYPRANSVDIEENYTSYIGVSFLVGNTYYHLTPIHGVDGSLNSIVVQTERIIHKGF